MTNDDFRKKVDQLPAVQLPRDCEFDGTMMVIFDRGIRCSKCGHELLDIPRESERPRSPEICHCPNCFHKRETGASMLKVT